jgi:hypothetical protein
MLLACRRAIFAGNTASARRRSTGGGSAMTGEEVNSGNQGALHAGKFVYRGVIDLTFNRFTVVNHRRPKCQSIEIISVTTDLAGRRGRKVFFRPRRGKPVFTILSPISAEREFAPLDARVLTRTVRAARIPHYPDWQALGSNARGLAQSWLVADPNAKWIGMPTTVRCRSDPPGRLDRKEWRTQESAMPDFAT